MLNRLTLFPPSVRPSRVKRTLLKSKIHRARVTGADVHYEGSVSIDPNLMRQADIVPFEKVAIWDVTNGARIETYAIPGKEGSGSVCINGAAAHLVHVDDIVIIGSYAEYDDAVAKGHQPTLLMVDPDNKNNILGK